MVTLKEQVIENLELFLDEQILQTERTLENLDELRAAVIRQDQGALEQLQNTIRLESRQKEQTLAQQRRLREQLSTLLGCPAEEITVSRVCDFLGSNESQTLQTRQRRLLTLIGKLKNEHQATELMLRECARFNRLLLSSLIGERNQTRTYTVQGKEQWNVHQGLMNMKM
jgi:hypothetical protein